jgi:putative transposase
VAVISLAVRAVSKLTPLRGGEFWGKGYFVNTVGQHGGESVIAAYVAEQGGEGKYEQLHKGQMNLEF